MSSPPSPRKTQFLEAAAVASRWLLGLWFVYLGLVKAVDPQPFIGLVRQYDVVTNHYLLNVISALLPWFEVFCGLLLVAGIAVRGSALAMVLLLVPFTALILKRGLALASAKSLALCAIKFDCGCGNGEVYVCPKLAENCLLILLAAWLVTGRGRRWCARFSLF
jgi:uncharacterized membrane protein YphA (DoxX/SURF4 family)